MSAGITTARKAAQTAVALGRREPDAETKRKVGLVLLDFVGCCMEVVRSPIGAAARAYGESHGGAREAHQWGVEQKVSAECAALANGILGHGLIREDMHVPSGTHPGVVILPAMLALAERERLSGASLLRGIATGYHLMGALGVAARTGLTNRRFRPLGISGPFGAAAGAVAATGADEDTATHALALAANFAAGMNQWPWSGGQDIYVHAGMAARNGLVAYDLARAGVKASEDILEGEDGLFAAIGSGPTACVVLLERLEGPNGLLEVTHKPAPGCNYVQTAAAVALRLHAKLGASGTGSIRRIVISTFQAARSYPGCDSTGPFSRLEQSKMSFQYAIGAALRFGRLDNDVYSRYEDAELQRLIALTELRVDPVFERRTLPRQPGRVEVELANGERLAGDLDDVPWLDATAVRDRFDAVARPVLGAADTQRLFALVDDLWQQDDTSELFGLLRKTG